MNFDFFLFMVFMSLSSFAMAFCCYVLVLRLFGDNRWIEMIFIPAAVVAFDFAVMVVGDEYKYFLGAVPMAAVAGMVGYAHFFKGVPLGENNSVAPQVSREEKKFSAKSARIHAAREKRGGK